MKVDAELSTDWDINKYRDKFTPLEHWELKREFMEAHKDKIEEDRLVCLAQTYVNMELLGCRYPEEVMKQVKALAEGLGSKYKEFRHGKLGRYFVKASDAAKAKVRRDPPMNGQSKNELSANGVYPASISSQTKLLTSLVNRSINSIEPLEKMVLMLFPFNESQAVRPHNFLNRSAMMFKMKYCVEFQGDGYVALLQNSIVYRLKAPHSKGPKHLKEIQDVIGTALLKKLCSKCLLLELKKRKHGGIRDPDEIKEESEFVQMEELLNEKKKDDKVLEESIGSKLMKMMGWSGGGLGKNEHGRVDPIEPSNLMGRQGIGYKGSMDGVFPEFRKKVKNMINQFCREVTAGVNTQNELVFSPAFSKEQRAFIHKIVKQYGMNHRSYGKGDKRYLVISNKISVYEKILLIAEAGGETEEFKVHAPGTYEYSYLRCTAAQ